MGIVSVFLTLLINNVSQNVNEKYPN